MNIEKLTRYAGRAALPFLAALTIYAAGCGSGQAPTPQPTATYTAAQRNNAALDAIKRHATKYYDSVFQFYQGKGGYTDYKTALSPMIADINRILPELSLNPDDFDSSMDALTRYFETQNVLVLHSFTSAKNAEVAQFLVADIKEKEQEIMGERKIEIVEYGNVRVKSFVETVSGGGRIEGFKTQGMGQDKVYIDSDVPAERAELQWNQFERQRQDWLDRKRRSAMPEPGFPDPAGMNLRNYTDLLRAILNGMEYADLYLAHIDNKRAFIDAHIRANKRLTKYHELEHVKNEGKIEAGSAIDEASAMYAELVAADSLPPEFMYDGLATLGNILYRFYAPPPNPEAAKIVLECYVNTLLANQEKVPALKLGEIDLTDKLAFYRVLARFASLKKDEITSLAAHCEDKLGKPKSTLPKRNDHAGKSFSYPVSSYPYSSVKEKQRRTEGRFARDLRSRMKTKARV